LIPFRALNAREVPDEQSQSFYTVPIVRSAPWSVGEGVDCAPSQLLPAGNITRSVVDSGEPMAEQLADKQCVPCRGGVPPLKGTELQKLRSNVPSWNVVNEHHLQREFRFPDFKQALDFVNRVGAVAEEQGHHPDILLSWGKAGITIWTHKIDGLTESDFIMAAKIDRLAAS
jgi:4a-hydroxytetrahydrobiopterin dehydratase